MARGAGASACRHHPEESPVSKPFKWFLVFLALALVLLVTGVVALFWMSWRQQRVAQRTVIEIDFADPIEEVVANDPFAELFAPNRMRLRDVVEALRVAAHDDKVVGLVADLSAVQLGIAQIEEVRDAVTAFRASGKPAIAYADSFGEVTPANGAYYLASAFDEVYIQPSGDVGFTGLHLTSLFLRGTLDKLGVTPEFAQRHEYKNAMNTFTETAFTPAHREAMDALAGSIFEHMLAEIAKGRQLEVEALRAAVDSGPLLGEDAVRAKLVNGLRYRDEVYDRLEERVEGNGDHHLRYLYSYWKHARRPHGGRVVAVVYGVGSVVRGESQTDVFGGSVMGSRTVAAALRAASEDDDVAAIVMRVDSPGGSYVASDTIWREVMRARERGKPVIVSMGDVAASGGYFVAAPADKIVAHPSTITGSIGVLGGKFVTTEMWSKVGISFDSVQRGEHAEMWSSGEPFDPDEWAKFNAWLDRVYTDFTGKVAAGRDLPIEQVREIAKGRVWSGVDAKRIGLVDELGGWETAVRLAREAAGLAADADVRLREYPRTRGFFEELFAPEPESSEDEGTESASRITGALRGLRALRALQALRAAEPLLRELHAAGLTGEQPPAVLRMPPVEAR
jgi:protease-4